MHGVISTLIDGLALVAHFQKKPGRGRHVPFASPASHSADCKQIIFYGSICCTPDPFVTTTTVANFPLQLIPVNRRYPLAELSETLRTHFPRMSKPKRDETTRASDRSKDKSTDESVTHFVVGVNKGAATPMMATVGEGKELVEQAERLKLKSGSKETFKSAHGTPIEEATGVFTPTDGWVNRQRRRRKSRILAVEYTLLGGVNDSVEDAHRLADWLRGVACVVNLITFNAHEGTPFSSSSLETSKAFRQALTVRGQLCTFRDSRGDDGMAACG